MTAASWWGALDAAGFHAMRVLLSVLWQSSIVLAVAAGLGYLLRRRQASVRHGLWVAALFAAPVLPLLTWAASSIGAPQAQIPVMPTYSAPPVVHVVSVLEAHDPVSAGGAAGGEESRFWVRDYPWAAALLAYAAGVGVLALLVVVGRLRIAGWIGRGRAARDQRTLEAFRSARDQLPLTRAVRVIESEGVPTPLTVGTYRPTVLLPTGLAENLSDGELAAVAVHELAHVKRLDPLVLALVSLMRAALFFHPLVWLAARQVANLAERACDDAVLDAGAEPVSYAQMLARLAEELPRRSLTTEMAAGIVLTKGAFLRRVEAILSNRRDRIRRLSRLALACTVAGALLSLAVAAALPLGARAVAPDDAGSDATPHGDVQVHVVRWMALLDKEGAEHVREMATPVEATTTAYDPMVCKGGALLAAVREMRTAGHVLHLTPRLRWLDLRPDRPVADTFSDSAILKIGRQNQPYVCSAGGTYRFRATGELADMTLDYPALHAAVSTARVEGAFVFEGALKAGDALALLAPLGAAHGLEPSHLIVWQAAMCSDERARYVRAVRSAQQLVERGVDGMAELADEAMAWGALADSTGQPSGNRWTRQLPGGVTVKLVAVGRPAHHPFIWWNGDGKPVRIEPAQVHYMADDEWVAVLEVADPVLREVYPDMSGKKNPFRVCPSLPPPQYGKSATLLLGVGTGAWESQGTLKAMGDMVKVGGVEYVLKEVESVWRKDARFQRPGAITVLMSFSEKADTDVALTVVEKSGKEHHLAGLPVVATHSPARGDPPRLAEVDLTDGKDLVRFVLRSRPRQQRQLFQTAFANIADVERFVLKTRPRRWITFTDIAQEPVAASQSAVRGGEKPTVRGTDTNEPAEASPKQVPIKSRPFELTKVEPLFVVVPSEDADRLASERVGEILETERRSRGRLVEELDRLIEEKRFDEARKIVTDLEIQDRSDDLVPIFQKRISEQEHLYALQQLDLRSKPVELRVAPRTGEVQVVTGEVQVGTGEVEVVTGEVEVVTGGLFNYPDREFWAKVIRTPAIGYPPGVFSEATTPEDRQVLAQLREEFEFAFDQTPLEDVVAFLQEVTPPSYLLVERDIPPDGAPVTLKVRTTLRKALDLITSLTGMAWKVEDGVIKIGRPESLRVCEMRLYDVRDLLVSVGDAVAGDGRRLLSGSLSGRAENLVLLIKQACGAGTWMSPGSTDLMDVEDEGQSGGRGRGGGPGQLSPEFGGGVRPGFAAAEFGLAPTPLHRPLGRAFLRATDPGSIMILQSAEVHKCIEELLRALRGQMQLQVEVSLHGWIVDRDAFPRDSGAFRELAASVFDWSTERVSAASSRTLHTASAAQFAQGGSSALMDLVKEAKWHASGRMTMNHSGKTPLRWLSGTTLRPTVAADRRHVLVEFSLSPLAGDVLQAADVATSVSDRGMLLVVEHGPLAPVVAANWVGEQKAKELDLADCAVVLLVRPAIVMFGTQDADGRMR